MKEGIEVCRAEHIPVYQVQLGDDAALTLTLTLAMGLLYSNLYKIERSVRRFFSMRFL